MVDELRAAEIDGRIARALRREAPALAKDVIETHDHTYPGSNLRSIPYEDRLRWVESWVDFFAGCDEAGEFEPWEYSHLAAISRNFEPGLPPYYRIRDCYENTLPLEAVALPFVWQEFRPDPNAVRLRAAERLHDLFQTYMRVNTEPLYGQVAAYEQRVVQQAREREREACDARMAALASGPIPALADKISQVGEAVEAGEVARGLTSAEIARDLGLSMGTVRNYISTLMVKLGADNRTQLVVLALRQGLLA